MAVRYETEQPFSDGKTNIKKKVSALLTLLGKEVLLMNELDHTFAEVAQIIEEARSNAYRKVNEELILMYQKVGQTAYEAKSFSRFLYCGNSGFAGYLPRERLP